MLRVFADGTRREWLRVGSLGLAGLSLPQLVSASTRPAKSKSVIVFGLLGGPSQHDTWDPKPNAPAEIRGPYQTIPTRTAGLRVCELMPQTALLTQHIAVLRAVVTNDNAHSSSGYQMLTGVPHVPMNQENVISKAPNNAPSLGAVVRYLRQMPGKLPAAVTIPEHIWNDGNIPWPGQDAGILGRKHNPWLVNCDPSQGDFKIDSLSTNAELTPLRLEQRRGLLEQLNQHLDTAASRAEFEGHSQHFQKAFELVSSRAARAAFDLNQESPATRDRYGRTRFGQSCLLARRLIESGVSLVQVNWTRIAGALVQGMWDTHNQHNQAVKQVLMPIMDQAYSALLADLQERGLLDDTLVVWTGEFGRTPKINGNGGRDHWGHCFSVALAGGGVRGGTVYGASDKIGGYPADGRVEARDVVATILHSLGIDPSTELRDTEGRPIPASRGQTIQALL
jgi:hypothetical protein